MIIINQGNKVKPYNVPGIGIVPIENMQKIEEDSMLGKGMLKHHSQVCYIDNKVTTKDKVETKKELLLEEPTCAAEVETKDEDIVDKVEVEVELPKVKVLKDFNTKEDLESYAKEVYNIELDNSKTLRVMHNTLVKEIKELNK